MAPDFLLTEPIKRYIGEIKHTYESRSQNSTSTSVLPFTCTFKTYKDSEPFLQNYEEERIKFIKYLEKTGGVSLVRQTNSDNAKSSRWADGVVQVNSVRELQEK